ncbi:hypothetical protein AB3S75_038591 [Citrus x aurantiifolia]
MGNWRNRPHRRFFYRQRSPQTPPLYSLDNEPSSSGFCNDGIPIWEKKFCASIGKVPWQKIVDTQKFMYNENVLNWDDSAGKEAFQNAKERFWAHINDFPCRISLPDPDIYIDEIDWNAHIDPELITDLESVYFAPDDGEKDPKVWRRFKRLRNLASIPEKECNGNSGSIVPWECTNNKEVDGALKGKAQSWNQWDDSNGDLRSSKKGHNPWESSFTQGNDVVKDKIWGWKQGDGNSNSNDAKKSNDDDNPWKRSCSQGNEPVKKCTWGNYGDKLWGLNQGADHGNPWERSCQSVDPVKDNKGWGDSGNNSECWSQQKSWKQNTGDNPWNPNFSKCTRPPTDVELRGNAWNRGWRSNGGDPRGWKPWVNQNNGPNRLEFEKSGGNRGAWSRSCRKREGSHLSGYKSSGYQEDYNQTEEFWRSKNTNKRMQFCT